jgi:hypothetical protein
VKTDNAKTCLFPGREAKTRASTAVPVETFLNFYRNTQYFALETVICQFPPSMTGLSVGSNFRRNEDVGGSVAGTTVPRLAHADDSTGDPCFSDRVRLAHADTPLGMFCLSSIDAVPCGGS